MNPIFEPVLTPGYHGEACAGNGAFSECCCDACDDYLTCFPDWETFLAQGAPPDDGKRK